MFIIIFSKEENYYLGGKSMNNIKQKIISSDIKLFYLLNVKINYPWLTKLMAYITHLGSKEFTIVLPFSFVFISLFETNNTKILYGIELLLSLSLSHIFIHFIKRITNRPRPYEKISKSRKLIIPLEGYSFPSGHTTASFSIATTLSLLFPVFNFLLLSLALLVGISRIHLGVHYPTDVIIGGLIGFIFSWGIHILYF